MIWEADIIWIWEYQQYEVGQNSQLSQEFRFRMRAGSHYSDFKPVGSAENLCSNLEIPEAPPTN